MHWISQIHSDRIALVMQRQSLHTLVILGMMLACTGMIVILIFEFHFRLHVLQSHETKAGFFLCSAAIAIILFLFVEAPVQAAREGQNSSLSFLQGRSTKIL